MVAHQPHIAVHSRRHRLVRDLGIAVGNGDAMFLVQADQHLRIAIAKIIDETVLKPAIAGTWHHSDIRNIETANEFSDNVTAPPHFHIFSVDGAINGHFYTFFAIPN